jgi:hypothetical protein
MGFEKLQVFFYICFGYCNMFSFCPFFIGRRILGTFFLNIYVKTLNIAHQASRKQKKQRKGLFIYTPEVSTMFGHQNRAAPRGTRVERQPRVYVGNLLWSVDEAQLSRSSVSTGRLLAHMSCMTVNTGGPVASALLQWCPKRR